MSEDPSTFDYENDTKYIRLIEYMKYGVYRIKLESKSGKVLETIARISRDTKDESMEFVDFDSEEFGRQVMKGFILSMPICHAVMIFHKACTPYSKSTRNP